ncbi:MAG: hypothetical protein LQ341_005481, partial [Variospora aurantia]
ELPEQEAANCEKKGDQEGANKAKARIPVGLDAYDRLPCGHRYDAAMMELWLSEQGLLKTKNTHNGPITLATHQEVMLDAFELFFGAWTFDKMTNKRLRAVAAKEIADENDGLTPANLSKTRLKRALEEDASSVTSTAPARKKPRKQKREMEEDTSSVTSTAPARKKPRKQKVATGAK